MMFNESKETHIGFLPNLGNNKAASLLRPKQSWGASQAADAGYFDALNVAHDARGQGR